MASVDICYRLRHQISLLAQMGIAMTEWIFDLGVSDGQDSAFYLAKGFNVVGVEADPVMCEKIRNRFADQIESGQMILVNKAASARAGEKIEIHVHQAHQGISGINLRPEAGGYLHYFVESVDWATLRASYPVPRYVKIDIEGSESAFLAGMKDRDDLPEFISVEAYDFSPILALCDLGYTRFKMIDQTASFFIPCLQREGLSVDSPDFTHASGPFGLDVFFDEAWVTADDIFEVWKKHSQEFDRTWFDCHAWLK